MLSRKITPSNIQRPLKNTFDETLRGVTAWFYPLENGVQRRGVNFTNPLKMRNHTELMQFRVTKKTLPNFTILNSQLEVKLKFNTLHQAWQRPVRGPHAARQAP